jgi:hypothetical protein
MKRSFIIDNNLSIDCELKRFFHKPDYFSLNIKGGLDSSLSKACFWSYDI